MDFFFRDQTSLYSALLEGKRGEGEREERTGKVEEDRLYTFLTENHGEERGHSQIAINYYQHLACNALVTRHG